MRNFTFMLLLLGNLYFGPVDPTNRSKVYLPIVFFTYTVQATDCYGCGQYFGIYDIWHVVALLDEQYKEASFTVYYQGKEIAISDMSIAPTVLHDDEDGGPFLLLFSPTNGWLDRQKAMNNGSLPDNASNYRFVSQ
ncbi:hypothetical protein BH09PAT2_BH09PAT2_07680 [soil metagenome]